MTSEEFRFRTCQTDLIRSPPPSMINRLANRDGWRVESYSKRISLTPFSYYFPLFLACKAWPKEMSDQTPNLMTSAFAPYLCLQNMRFPINIQRCLMYIKHISYSSAFNRRAYPPILNHHTTRQIERSKESHVPFLLLGLSAVTAVRCAL